MIKWMKEWEQIPPKKYLTKKNVKQKQTILQTKQNVYKMSNVSWNKLDY